MISSPASVPSDRRPGRPVEPLGQHERHDRDQRAQSDGQHERVPAGEQERDQHPDREDQRQGQGDERANAAPTGHGDRDQREEDRQAADQRQPPAVDDREARRAVLLGVDRYDDLVANEVVGQLELAGRTLEVGRLALARRGPSRNSIVAVGATSPVGGWSSTIRAWIRSETRPWASAGVRSGSRTRIAATARSPSANRTISRSDRRRPEPGRGSAVSGWTGVGSTIIGGRLPSASSGVTFGRLTERLF